VAVVEARISHLAYSSEIAGAMLRKQAASAVVAQGGPDCNAARRADLT
jgi:hypothetical protein